MHHMNYSHEINHPGDIIRVKGYGFGLNFRVLMMNTLPRDKNPLMMMRLMSRVPLKIKVCKLLFLSTTTLPRFEDLLCEIGIKVGRKCSSFGKKD